MMNTASTKPVSSSTLSAVTMEFVPGKPVHSSLSAGASSFVMPQTAGASSAEPQASTSASSKAPARPGVVLSLLSAIACDPSDESGDDDFCAGMQQGQYAGSGWHADCSSSAQKNQLFGEGAHPASGAFMLDLDDYTDDSESSGSEDNAPSPQEPKSLPKSVTSLTTKQEKIDMLSDASTPATPTSMQEDEPGAEPLPENNHASSESEPEEFILTEVATAVASQKMGPQPEAVRTRIDKTALVSYLTESEPEDQAMTLMERLAAEHSSASESEPDGELATFVKGLFSPGASSESEPEAEEASFWQIQKQLQQSPAAPVAPAAACFAVAELMRWRTADIAKSDYTLVATKVGTSSSASTPSASGACSWRRPADAKSGCRKTKPSASNSAPSQAKLQVSESGWVSQQRSRRTTDSSSEPTQEIGHAEFSRKIKAILNKLSVEKFAPLSAKLLEVGFASSDHVQILIEEIFERATTQHHYIDMYTNLCELAHTFFSENPISEDPKCGFKRLLLNECQRSFERNLEPPVGLESLDFDERTLAEVKYKTRMLGNIRFVGALLARHMLASKVLISILDDLLSDPIPEALETVAALLTVTGPVFDTSDWPHHPRLAAIFAQLQELSSNKSTSARVRCLLKDLMDLRARKWQETRQVKIKEAPTTLRAVAEKRK
jgi:hypothetical protein